MNDGADDKVVRTCQQGDTTAYAGLVQRHYRHVFALCLGFLANVHDAEDVAQDTVLKGLQSIRRLSRPGQFEPWILRIAKNLCIDLLRRRQRIKKYAAEPEPVLTPDSNEDRDLEQALRRLPQELRLPLTLFYFEHKDAASIARQLKISPSLTYDRLRAARQELHKLLTERGSHEE
jgi:RNA polymerase sigma-70 factor, ECF subfamily